MTDPIADMLSQFRNALAVNQPQVRLRHSKIRQAVAELLARNGYLQSVKTEGAGLKRQLVVTVFDESSGPRITSIKRLSRPGRRLYSKADAVPVVKRGRGMIIVSTPRGLMSGQEARSQRLGGELICEVY